MTLLEVLAVELAEQLPDWKVEFNGSDTGGWVSLKKVVILEGSDYTSQLQVVVDSNELGVFDWNVHFLLRTWPLSSSTLVAELVQFFSEYEEEID